MSAPTAEARPPMSELKTRPPTGRAPWPLILIEGGEKAGKSWAIAELSASPKVGQTYWIDLGEGSADEYGAVPDARYLVVEHDGSYRSILRAVEAIRAEAAKVPPGQPPVVVGVDSMTSEWDLLKGQADAKARERLKKKGRAVADDAEPQISMDLWNEANTKHRRLMTMLMTFPGIVVMTARGKEVAALDSAGHPVEGSKEYRVEGQKNLAYDASVWIRVSRDHPPMVVGARSVHAGVRPGVDKPRPAPGLTLEKVVFDILRCNPAEAEVRVLVEPKTVEPDESTDQPAGPPAPTVVRDWALDPTRTEAELRDALARIRREYPKVLDEALINEHGDDETVLGFLQRRIADLAGPATGPGEPNTGVTQKQHARMHVLWAKVGYGGDANRDNRLKIINSIIRRETGPMTSSKELTEAEAGDVIRALDNKLRELESPQQVGAST